jgi:hypothetical protein
MDSLLLRKKRHEPVVAMIADFSGVPSASRVHRPAGVRDKKPQFLHHDRSRSMSFPASISHIDDLPTGPRWLAGRGQLQAAPLRRKKFHSPWAARLVVLPPEPTAVAWSGVSPAQLVALPFAAVVHGAGQAFVRPNAFKVSQRPSWK